LKGKNPSIASVTKLGALFELAVNLAWKAFPLDNALGKPFPLGAQIPNGKKKVKLWGNRLWDQFNLLGSSNELT